MKNQNQNQSKKISKPKKKQEESLKVVYISTPMKVTTSASRFRSLVQELTGKNSDVSQYMDDNDYNQTNEFQWGEIDDRQKLSSSVSTVETPTSSDYSLGEKVDDSSIFVSRTEELQFEEIFSSRSFYDPFEMDVLGSFDDLL